MSAVHCRNRLCRHPLGQMNTSGVVHLAADTVPTFVDLIAGTMTFRCGKCGATMQFRDGRVDLKGEQR